MTVDACVDWAGSHAAALKAAKRLGLDPRRADVQDAACDAAADAWITWRPGGAPPDALAYLIARRAMLRLCHPLRVDLSLESESRRGWSAHVILEETLAGVERELATDVWLRDVEATKACWSRGIRADQGIRVLAQAKGKVRQVLESLGEGS